MVLNKSKMSEALADFRLTDYASIERWWEIIFSAYLLISWQVQAFKDEAVRGSVQPNSKLLESIGEFSLHPYWETGTKSEKCFK